MRFNIIRDFRYKSRKELLNNESDEERYRRRYGMRGEENEGTKSTNNSVGDKGTKVASSRSEVPLIHYQDDQTDSSGESSNIVQVYANNDRGKNAH